MEIPAEIAWGLFENFRLRKSVFITVVTKRVRTIKWPLYVCQEVEMEINLYANTWILKTIRSLSRYYRDHVSLEYIAENCDVDMFREPVGEIAMKNNTLTKSLCDLYLPNIFPTNKGEPTWERPSRCEKLALSLFNKILKYKVNGIDGLMNCYQVDVFLNYSDFEYLVSLILDFVSPYFKSLKKFLGIYRPDEKLFR
ncbi:hypothetical protein BNJ_00423 [Kaumoebavirus]|uniref:hypothetical protein n=1 Tax=Kaumoebavirus TaxID=1859492 RepID=UPI0009C22382|nr:hypothetical protein BNJ_00423 [Kaumoebavirus]ARA72238.1 hypothetical protein BNJ_00423 [Kaumoebavirus]